MRSGRKKIETERIIDKSRQQVTFSKRLNGLFKNITELSIICDAQVAIITFSPAKKPYVCGDPDLILNLLHNSNGETKKKDDELYVYHEKKAVYGS
ncbi:hypothetical protein MKX03_001875 [Papaver bracteatum]|nr:hypothetical protein MKX03_001875 [Papaver bracteatum]